MVTARPRSERSRRSVSELQREAPAIIKEASERGDVEITRYGDTVAYVVSPEAWRRAQAIEENAIRAQVALEYKRAFEDLETGNVVEWEQVAAELRAIARGK